MDKQTDQPGGEINERKYLLLLLSLLAVVLLIPIYHEFRAQVLRGGGPGTVAGFLASKRYLPTVLFVVVMIFGVHAAAGHRMLRLFGTSLWVVALVLYVSGVATLQPGTTPERVVETTIELLSIGGLVMLTVLILVDLFREAGVTLDRLRGAACAYLLMGMAWALAYSMVHAWVPGSFALGEGIAQLETNAGQVVGDFELAHATYYSFVTLTTIGYGDITPVRPLAMTLAWLEAFTGQFYLTVLVAFLVGKRLAVWMARESK